MKIFFTSTVHGIDRDLDQVCPFHTKIKDRKHPYLVGSVACANCPYCYGYGQHPNSLHNLAIVPAYSIYDKDHREKTDSEISEEGLKPYKFISEENYVKCMLAYSEKGQKMFKNRFKLWWWKHIGERLSNLRCYIIDGFVELKIKIKTR